MDLTYETKDKEKSQVLLKITVKKEEIKKEYEKLVSEAQKEAEIPGFRKGKVPISILESRYKEGFLAETAQKIVEDAFKEVIDKVEKKPITYSTPKIDKIDMPKLDEDFSFELYYDVFPEYTYGTVKSVEVEKDEVKISNEDVEKEIEKLIKEFSTIEPKEGKIEENDIALIDYSVYHDDKEVYKKDNEHIYIGKDYDMYKIGNDIIGMKKGEEKEFSKTFSDEEIENLKGKTFNFKLTIKEIKQEKKPELNDELAKQIDENCATVNDLKNKIKENLEKYSDSIIRQKVLNAALEKLSDTFKGDIPQSMVDYQAEMYYQEILNRVGGNEKKVEDILKLDNLNKETYKEKMMDKAAQEIKIGLILQDIVKKENIVVSDEEVTQYVEPMAKQYKADVNKLINAYKDNGKYEILKNEVESKKAYDYLYEVIKTKKGKKLSYEELFK